MASDRRSWRNTRPLLLGMLAVAAIFTLLRVFHVNVRDPHSPIVFLLLVSIVAGYAASIVVMCVATKRWTTQGMAVLFTFAGEVTFWGSFLYSDVWTRRAPVYVLTLVVSLLLIAGPLLVFSSGDWIAAARVADPVDRLEDATDRNEALTTSLQAVSANQTVRQGEQNRRERTADTRETAADARQGVADRREMLADTRETRADRREARQKETEERS